MLQGRGAGQGEETPREDWPQRHREDGKDKKSEREKRLNAEDAEDARRGHEEIGARRESLVRAFLSASVANLPAFTRLRGVPYNRRRPLVEQGRRTVCAGRDTVS